MAINKKIVRGKEIVNHASNFLLRRCEAAFASLCDLRAVLKPENISSSQAKQSAVLFLRFSIDYKTLEQNYFVFKTFYLLPFLALSVNRPQAPFDFLPSNCLYHRANMSRACSVI